MTMLEALAELGTALINLCFWLIDKLFQMLVWPPLRWFHKTRFVTVPVFVLSHARPELLCALAIVVLLGLFSTFPLVRGSKWYFSEALGLAYIFHLSLGAACARKKP